MEQESPQQLQQYLEGAKTGIEIAQRTGIIKRIFSLVAFRKSVAGAGEQVDYGARAMQALQENAVETLANLELTVSEATQILNPEFTLGDLDKVNSTWQGHWVEGASKVGRDDEERRTWWARLLAGEIQQPGTYSLRTLAVMDTLSTREGELFTQVCQYVWSMPRRRDSVSVNPVGVSLSPILVLPREGSSLWRPNFEESAMLENAGLVTLVADELFYTSSADGAKGESTKLVLNSDTFLVNVPQGSSGLRCGSLLLTHAGEEIYRLTTPTCSESYRDEIVAEWAQRYEVLNIRDEL